MRSLLAVFTVLFLVGLGLPAFAQQTNEAAAKQAVDEFYKGHAALQQNDAQEAINHFSQALQIGNLDPTQVAYVHHYRAIAYQRLNKQQEAIDDYTQALASGSLPQRVQAAIYYNRAIALDHLANFDRAIKDYSQAITLKPDYAEAYMNRGNAYRKLGDNDSALKDYEKSAALGNPIKQLPYYGEGLVLEAKGDKQGALKAFQTALLLAPDFEPAKLKVEGYQAAGIEPAAGATVVAAAKPAQSPAPAPAQASPSAPIVAYNTAPEKPKTPAPIAEKPTQTKQASQQAENMSLAKPVGGAATATPAPMKVASNSPTPKAPVSTFKPAGTGTTASINPPVTATPTTAPTAATMPMPSKSASDQLVVSDTVAKPAEPPAASSAETSKPADQQVADAAVPAVSQPQTPPQTASTTPAPAPEAVSKNAAAFHVQLGSYGSQDQAQTQASAIVSKQAALLNGLTQDIQKAELGAKGTYYRLRFGPFDSRDDAAAKCSALKSAGQACIVVK